MCHVAVACFAWRREDFFMKPLVAILVCCAFLYGIYLLYLKRMPTADSGTAPTQNISLAGVRMDLMQIAKAERNSIGVDGKCSSLDELLSSGSMSMSRPERDGYTYAVECSGTNFTATARHAPAPAGSPIRYPNLAIDQNMQVREVE
jgi:hypothetical protein